MNILLINHYAGSPKLGMEFRPYYLSREWQKAGHDVTILAASFSHVRTIQPRVSRSFSEEFIDGIRYVWIKTPAYSGNGVKRMLNMMSFVFTVWKKANYISKKYKPQVVIASSTYPLDNYPARRIAKVSRAKHVYEVHDLWPLSPMELGGYSPKHPFIFIMQKGENYAYKYADHVVSMLPKTREHMMDHGMASEKFNYIPNGINIEEWENQEEIPSEHLKLLQVLQKEKKQIVAYVGGHAISNALDVFIDSIKLLQNENIAFVLVGSGAEKNKLVEKARDLGLKNIYFLPPVPKNSIPQLLSFMDILYIGWKKQPLYRFGISPNKLMDYMMSAKPVIHSVAAGNDIVKESGCGISVEPENPEEIARAINLILKLSETERLVMGKKGKEFVIKNHNYKTLANNMLNIFTNQ
ncbi:MAG: glycosyltransferase family 4 protein [Bacteroidales bacterium]